jgi:hypothetical protein
MWCPVCDFVTRAETGVAVLFQLQSSVQSDTLSRWWQRDKDLEGRGRDVCECGVAEFAFEDPKLGNQTSSPSLEPISTRIQIYRVYMCGGQFRVSHKNSVAAVRCHTASCDYCGVI